MKTAGPDKAIKVHFKKYEQLLNKEFSQRKITYNIAEERLLTNYLVHDLATPLSSAHAAFLILENSKSYKTSKEVLNSGKVSVESAVELLSSLRDLKSAKDKKRLFNVSDSIDKVVKILHSKASKLKINITYCNNHGFYLKSYELIFQRVLMNIVNNSIEELAVCSKEVKQIQINVYSEEEYLIICIKDNGKGIPQEFINKIYSQGYSTKKSHMGLGLSFVYQALKTKLDGQIQIQSKNGEYTEVFLKLKGLCKN